MWLLENEGEALDGKTHSARLLLPSANDRCFQVNGFGCDQESGISLAEQSLNVCAYSVSTFNTPVANANLAGQLAIRGEGAERVSRKHVTIQVDEVTEGDGVRHPNVLR